MGEIQKNSEIGTIKQQKFVAGLFAGKSMLKAALDAGYTDSSARVACRAIMPSVRALFGTMLSEYLPLQRQTKLLAEGMEANTTKFFSEKGIVTDERELVDWSARHNFQRLAAQIQGLLPEKMELTGENGGELIVKIVAVGRE